MQENKELFYYANYTWENGSFGPSTLLEIQMWTEICSKVNEAMKGVGNYFQDVWENHFREQTENWGQVRWTFIQKQGNQS